MDKNGPKERYNLSMYYVSYAADQKGANGEQVIKLS
jgi:hypothetical protein